MTKIRLLAAGLVLAAFSLAPAFAQGVGQLNAGQVWGQPTSSPGRAVPASISQMIDQSVGSTRGSVLERGASGWRIVVPSVTAGLPWVSGGTGADPLYQVLSAPAFPTSPGVITGSMIANQNASTLFGNSATSSAAPGSFAISSLVSKASPAATDLVIIQDQAASGQLKQATVASVASAGSVGSWNGLTGAVTSVVAAQGRLTLASHTPVMAASQTSQATLYYDSYVGNQVMYFTGSADVVDTISSNEVSTAMQSSSTGVLNANGVFDVWWEGNTNHKICVATNGSGGGWASDTAGSNTARGTGYSQLDKTTRPYITNANTVAHCYNGATDYGSITANKLTYLGTILTDAASAGLVSYTFGASASGGTAARFGVWNAYNRVIVATTVTDSGTQYTYTTATVRQARASAGNQIGFVVGIPEDGVIAAYSIDGKTTGAGGAQALWGFGFDSTIAFSGPQGYVFSATAVALAQNSSTQITWTPGAGLHVLSANEKGDGTNANIFDFSSLGSLSASLRM
jgi:hypothetical protein